MNLNKEIKIKVDYEILENSHKERRLVEIKNFCKYLLDKYDVIDIGYSFEEQCICIFTLAVSDKSTNTCKDHFWFILAEIEAIKHFG